MHFTMNCARNANIVHDRFIPFRSKHRIEAASYLIKSDALDVDPIENQFPDSEYTNPVFRKRKKQEHQTIIKAAMGISNHKILKISNVLTDDSKRHYSTWPAYARKRPVINSPDVMLDLPNLDTDLCHHVTDWGPNEILAFIYEGEIYIWKYRLKTDRVLTNTNKRIKNCVRWNKSGDKLGVGLNHAFLGIVDYSKKSLTHECLTCGCRLIFCEITSLEWSSDGYLITGCNKGTLCKWNSCLHLLACQFSSHLNSIITIALSCNEQYLVTTSSDATVRVWFWPSLLDNFEIKCNSNIRGIAWHPWRESLFAIGGGVPDGTIRFWSAASHKQVAERPAHDNRFVDTMAWNSISGELVVSYWYPQNDNSQINPYLKGRSSVVVFSDLDTIVDAIEWHAGTVLYLLWGCNGRLLATAGSDEHLCIWDFFGTPNKKDKKTKLYRRLYGNEKSVQTIFSPTFGQTIR